MATWHCEFLLLPKCSVLQKFHVIPQKVEDSTISKVDWWNSVDLNLEELSYKINSILIRNNTGLFSYKGWSSEIMNWGSEDGNRLEIVLDDSAICEISVRIDLRNISQAFIKSIIELCTLLDCYLIAEDCSLFKPSEDKVLSLLKKSLAHKFVENPEDTFDKITRANNQ